MRKYKTFPYTNGLCLPCCLQSILDYRGLKVPAKSEISLYFGEADDSLFLTEQDLNLFLKKYNLRARHELPEASIALTIKQSLENNSDILAAYSYLELFNAGKFSPHVSLIADFNESIEKEVLLFDSGFPDCFLKRVSLPDLINSILAIKSTNSGFYLISSQ